MTASPLPADAELLAGADEDPKSASIASFGSTELICALAGDAISNPAASNAKILYPDPFRPHFSNDIRTSPLMNKDILIDALDERMMNRLPCVSGARQSDLAG
jgi:hypothetical protein